MTSSVVRMVDEGAVVWYNPQANRAVIARPPELLVPLLERGALW